MTGDVRSKAFWYRSEQAQNRVEAVTCRFTDRCASWLSLLDTALRWWESVVMSGTTPRLAAVEEGVVPVLHLRRQTRWCHVGRGGLSSCGGACTIIPGSSPSAAWMWLSE